MKDDEPLFDAEKARRLLSGPFGEMLITLVANHTTTFAFAVDNAEGISGMKNGSAFFLRTPKRLLVVTAKHVYREFVKYKKEQQSVTCQLGLLKFDPEQRLIEEGIDGDIATFDFQEQELEKVGTLLGRQKMAITGWPSVAPEEGGGILFAGFPGVERHKKGRRAFEFGICAGSGVCLSSGSKEITTAIDHDQLITTTLSSNIPPLAYNTGGMSGGPILTLVQRSGLLSWRLGGVITDGLRMVDAIIGQRADIIDDQGFVHG